MNDAPSDMEAMWSAFLQRWPLEKLRTMTLQEYTKAGDQDCFTYWVETRTKILGSIQGGTALKFGIYSQADADKKGGAKGGLYADGYGWRQRYGASKEIAFANVRRHLIDLVEAVRAGNVQRLEESTLAPIYRWKLAFLYQDRSSLQLLPFYSIGVIRGMARQLAGC